MPIMNTLYIHIGTPKTATTSIQGFLADNQKTLNQKGFCYPLFPYKYEDVSIKRNAHFLIGEDRLEPGSGVFREAMNQIKKLFQTYSNVILSDERIWIAPYERRMEIWNLLKQESEKEGFQIKIIVYLRRQDAYLASGWNFMVKNGSGSKCARSWEDYINGGSYNRKMIYDTHLKKLVSIWGRKNVLVRRFEPKRFAGGSIYADFLQTVGLQLTDEYQIAQFMRNEALKGNTHEIKRVLNELPGMDTFYHKRFAQMLSAFAGLSDRDYPCEMFSGQESQAFMEQYKEQNRKVAQEFFGEQELFDLTWKDAPKWEKDNPHMQDDIIRFIGICYMQLAEENRQLRRELKELGINVGQPEAKNSAGGLGRKIFHKIKEIGNHCL